MQTDQQGLGGLTVGPQFNSDLPEPPKPNVAPLSFGQKLVGITFNPSNDDKVGRVKSLFAEIADLVKEDFDQNETTSLKGTLYEHTIGEILNAQMNCVKLLTLKY